VREMPLSRLLNLLFVFCADSSSSIQEPLQTPSSELLTETASKELHNHLVLDIDNDTESTAL